MFSNNVLFPIIDCIKSYSQRNALCVNEIFYTYHQFGERISAIRAALQGINSYNHRVGLVIEDDIDTYAAIFALWLEGAAYVPLHPKWPMERCEDIIEQVGINLIIDPSNDVSRFKITRNCSILYSKSKQYIDDNLAIIDGISDSDIAYILFTSGSTGKPKGVPILRYNVGAFINALFEFVPDINCEDRCLQCFDLSFDNSVLSYLVPLTKGACMYTIPHNEVKYTYAAVLLEDHKLTFSYMVPSTIELMKPFFDELNLPFLRYSLFAGEALHADTAKLWHDCIPNAKLFCCYGPTETTVIMSYHECTRGIINKSHNGIISMGICMKGTKVLILDEDAKILPDGVTGEICIAGPQVFDGYWQNDALNQKVFVTIDGIRYYRSGDLGFIDEEGEIMSAGRKDFQVKIQGYRIELGEIEHHAREFLEGCNVACVSYENSNGMTEIAMFIEANEVDQDALVEYMKRKMPSYMIPSLLCLSPVFPLNGNGKIDKKRLCEIIKRKI